MVKYINYCGCNPLYCRAPFLPLATTPHYCSKCKNKLHVFCYGADNEGEGKLCVSCNGGPDNGFAGLPLHPSMIPKDYHPPDNYNEKEMLAECSSGSPLLNAFAKQRRSTKHSTAIPVSQKLSQTETIPTTTTTTTSSSSLSSTTTITTTTATTSSSSSSSSSTAGKRKRAPQIVNTKSQRSRACKWMEQEANKGTKHIPSKAVANFPDIFNTGNKKNNLEKASRWYKSREKYIINSSANKSGVSVQSATPYSLTQGSKRIQVKCAQGRGRKREQWVEWLYDELLDEFDRLRKLGVKFSPNTLKLVAKDLVTNSNHTKFNIHYRIANGQTMLETVGDAWIRRFMDVKNIVSQKQTGKLSVSPEKQKFIDKSIAVHIGELKRGFETGKYDESTMENFDETHFVINMDNGRTLGFKGDTDVKYADVTSGGEAMTMVVRLNVRGIENPFMIFKNKD